MIKYAIPLAVLSAFFAASALAQDPVPTGASLEERVTALERSLEAEQLERQALSKNVEEQHKLLLEAQAYLEQQGSESKALLAVFNEVEAAGFFFGEGYKSRELLLNGLRAYMQNATKGVPAAKPAAQAQKGKPKSARSD